MNDFFTDIHSGKPFGETNVHIKLPDGMAHWFHFKYSLIYQVDTPVTALISFADVTEQHEKDISYLRFVHSIGEHAEDHLGYVEVDLTTNLVEKHIGSPRWQNGFTEGLSYDESRQKVFADFIGPDSLSAANYYSLSSLMQKFEEGLYDFEDIWKIASENQDILWVKVRTELLCDSLSGHIKMFAHLTDITSAKEAQLAIASVAEALTGHFRSDYILVRIGSDEFMVFLPGSAGSVSSIALAVSSLLQKLYSEIH